MTAIAAAADVRRVLTAAKTGAGYGSNFFLADDAVERAAQAGALEAFEFDGAALVLCREPALDRVYYGAADPARLEAALARLGNLPPGRAFVADLVGREGEVEPWANAFAARGYTSLTRIIRMQRLSQGASSADTAADPDIAVAGPGDAEDIHAAIQTNFDVFMDQIPGVDEIRRAAAAETILIARADGRIAALLYYDRAGLTTVFRYWFVLPEYRTTGWGDKLIRRYFRDTAECRRSILWVHERNSRAIPIYRWYGYKPDSVIDVVMIKRA